MGSALGKGASKNKVDTPPPATPEDGKLASPANRAFVFIKPHAANDAVTAVVKAAFAKHGIVIHAEGALGGAAIDEGKLIDKHYYAIASKATILPPEELAVPADKFEAHFGVKWSEALAQGKAANAMQACERLELSPNELQEAWMAAQAVTVDGKAVNVVKFGGGFYCGRLEMPGKEPLFVFNPFFMAMRSKFTAPTAEIRYFDVSFDSKKLSWADFRGTVLGPTDPAKAPAESLRGTLYADWEKLGLSGQPDTTDNGVHASASPFEALAERLNWCGATIHTDTYGKGLLAAGVDAKTIAAWTSDPQVKTPDGSKGSLFDSLEDMDADTCLDKAAAIAKLN